MLFFRRKPLRVYACSLKTRPLATCLLAAIFALMLAGPAYVRAQDKPASNPGGAPVAKAVGTIKSIQADSITVAAESGGEVTAKLMASTKILRVPPGEKDLKNATALQAQDLQPGDRVLIRGQASTDGDGHTIVIAALAVIVMKQGDVAAKQQRERDDWQKRGVGGLVTKVDAATGTITISSGGMGATRSIAVHIAKDTILRRYAPDSVKFDDAKPTPASQFMAQIKAGDQLRARGTRNPDGSELSAEEVVSGSFRNIAGTIKAIDAASNTMTVAGRDQQSRSGGEGVSRLANEETSGGDGTTHRDAIERCGGRRERARCRRGTASGRVSKFARAGRRAGRKRSSRFTAHAKPPAQCHSGGPAKRRCRDDRLDRRRRCKPGNRDHAAGGSGRHPDGSAQSKRVLAAFAMVAERTQRRRGSCAVVNKSHSWSQSVLINVICPERKGMC